MITSILLWSKIWVILSCILVFILPPNSFKEFIVYFTGLSKKQNLDLLSNASEETIKNSLINTPSLHHSQDVKKVNKTVQISFSEYILINNDVQPTIDDLRKIMETTKTMPCFAYTLSTKSLQNIWFTLNMQKAE